MEHSTEGLDKNKLLQICMDGANMNWKFHKEMQSKSIAETGKSLIMIGSCGVHIIHAAFEGGFGCIHLIYSKTFAKFIQVNGSIQVYAFT